MTDSTAVLHDGTVIQIAVRGEGRALLLPTRLQPHHPAEAETMRQWGADPDLGPNLVNALAQTYRVVAADYEGHRMAHPAPDTLTPENVAADLLAIGDAADAQTFGYYGYSWLALCGLQLAIRTDRLWALIMGGYPPRGGPYTSMLAVTKAAHAMATDSAGRTVQAAAQPEPGDWDAVSVQTDEAQTRQFVTLYESLQGFDDAAAAVPPDLPRLAFAGSADRIDYGPQWGGVQLRIGETLAAHKRSLIEVGWDVRVLPGLDHVSAMHSSIVIPLIADWLEEVTARAS
jgi:hypothetical protein